MACSNFESVKFIINLADSKDIHIFITIPNKLNMNIFINDDLYSLPYLLYVNKQFILI